MQERDIIMIKQEINKPKLCPCMFNVHRLMMLIK